MTSHHFFVDASDLSNDLVTLRGEEARHAGRVLRIRVGEAITAADGSGRVVDAVVTCVGETVEADIRRQTRIVAPRPEVTLYQAVPKGDKLEVVVEKATEVGVHRIVPFIADRTVVKWDERKCARVHERLGTIARAAAKQSRAPFFPSVEAVAHSPDGASEASTVLVLHEQADERLRVALPNDPPDELCLVVGPEGGLSAEEVDRLVSRGARAVTLGPRILRTETAGPVAAAVIAYAYGWFG